MSEPLIIQGGMGIGVSNWRLANAVSSLGQLGVVSGTCLDNVLIRRLQDGDLDGDMRRSMKRFPIQRIAQWVTEKYYIPGGKSPDKPYKLAKTHSLKSPRDLLELTILANFVEIDLAREGHDGFVGINLLEKVQLPNVPSLYGAMMAGVDYVLMGAGIPREIPGVLDKLAKHETARLSIDVKNTAPDQNFHFELNPRELLGDDLDAFGDLKRPKFLAIVTSPSVATVMKKKATGRVDGFVVELATAGGHNAPPRGKMQLSDEGEPIYGPRDQCDLEAMRNLERPFWMAGSYSSPDKLREAIDQGAAGIQVGTAFAFCKESGLAPDIKDNVLKKVREGTAEIFTDPKASPTGFPFKVVQLENTASDQQVYEDRNRVCDLGYLRHLFLDDDGKMGLRCPAAPVDGFLAKGGELAETFKRKCLCNGLMANIGLPQLRSNGYLEVPLVTAGNYIKELLEFLKDEDNIYTAREVLQYLLDQMNIDLPALPKAEPATV